ncbi:MAG: hypothetical protein ACOC1K_04300, partial [Nanoarchaeota archaeon]
MKKFKLVTVAIFILLLTATSYAQSLPSQPPPGVPGRIGGQIFTCSSNEKWQVMPEGVSVIVYRVSDTQGDVYVGEDDALNELGYYNIDLPETITNLDLLKVKVTGHIPYTSNMIFGPTTVGGFVQLDMNVVKPFGLVYWTDR